MPEPGSETRAPTALIRAERVSKTFVHREGLFGRKSRPIHAVNGVSLHIDEGETLGLVGESGCGKSTFGRLLLRLLPLSSGRVFYRGEDISTKSATDLLPWRRRMQVIFQDPYSSLNPRMSIGATIREALEIHGQHTSRAEENERIVELLERVGLRADHARRYPHEFSGGQRQRVGIARALAVGPELIIADEPVSALDVSIQAQIVNLLAELQDELKLSYLFIAHDLKVVELVSHRVAVMYLGRVVELADRESLYRDPLHPYTRALFSAIPVPDPTAKRERVVMKGDVPSPLNPPSGCAFHPRCPIAEKGVCDTERPELREHRPGHWAACHLVASTGDSSSEQE